MLLFSQFAASVTQVKAASNIPPVLTQGAETALVMSQNGAAGHGTATASGISMASPSNNLPDPIVVVNVLGGRVEGRNWTEGHTIELKVNDPADYTDSTTFGQNPDNPGDPSDLVAQFNLKGKYSLKAGDLVSSDR